METKECVLQASGAIEHMACYHRVLEDSLDPKLVQMQSFLFLDQDRESSF